MKRFLTFLFVIVMWHSACLAQQAFEDSLKKIIALGKHDEEERKTISRLAINYYKSSPAKAKMYMQQLIPMAAEANDHMRLSSAYSLLLGIYQDEGNTDSVGYYLNTLKNVAAKVPDNYKVQGNYNQAVGLYYKKISDYKTALPYALAAVKFAELANNSDKPYIGGQWLNAGDVYRGLGQYNNAMDCNLKALRLFEESGSKRGEGFCYTNMAGLYSLLEQYSNALKSAKKSFEIKTQLNDNRGVCTALEAIGEANMNMKNFPQAFLNYQQALKIAVAEKMPIEEKTCYFNMATIFAAQDKESLAVLYFKKSKLLALQLKDTSSIAEIEAELIALQNNAVATAATENRLQSNIELFHERGDLNREALGYKNMVDFYTANKEFEKALAYNNKYHQAIDSIENKDLLLQIKKMEELYNVEKKEKEITLLKKDQELTKALLQKQKVFQYGAFLLSGLLLLSGFLLFNRYKLGQKMKEMELRNQIAADLHDEVGSSLSSIHMLSQMATKQGTETTHKAILERMSSNAKETMDKMSDIVWMIKPGETEAGNLKQRMERFAYEIGSTKNIDMQLNLQDLELVKLTMEQRKNIWLIFKEAVNNAVKYSGTMKMEISVLLQNKQLTLQIKDFGKGFDRKIIKKGNGIDNMQHRAAELKGILATESIENTGTAIQLTVPV